jgi:hypothetical protein
MNCRLTDEQRSTLREADTGRTLYAENPSHIMAQTLNGSYARSLRTVTSLVKREFLKEDGLGGYVITEEGRKALWGGLTVTYHQEKC